MTARASQPDPRDSGGGVEPRSAADTASAPRLADAPAARGRTRFETKMQVRPDDLDLFQHVHSSRYLDYVAAARYDQMARCYHMPWEEFTRLGLAWVVRSAAIEYKRPLRLGDNFSVWTWVDEIVEDGVGVAFEIIKHRPQRLCCDGRIHYTMIRLPAGRAERIPAWIAARYAL